MPDAQMVGPYRLERVLGTGSFATVWLARDELLERDVAVKILADNWSRDHEVRRRFLSEARVLLTVESPRIVRGFHLGEAETGQPYLVMAFADRGTLGDRIDQRRARGHTFGADEVIALGREIADALTDVHNSGHLHRDVKPTNVLVRSSSTRHDIAGLAPDETIVLGDFGLARGLDLSALTLVAGSPGYVAPEQAAGLTQLDRRADLYSLGRIMLELLTGDPGGRATTMAGAASERIDVSSMVADMVGGGQATPPQRLVELISRLVDEDPQQRPGSAEEVSAELDALTRAGAGRGRPLAPPIAPPPAAEIGPDDSKPLPGAQIGAAVPARGNALAITDKRVLAGAAAVVMAILGLVLANSLAGGDDPDADPATTAGGVVTGRPSPDTASPDTASPDTASPDTASLDTASLDTAGAETGQPLGPAGSGAAATSEAAAATVDPAPATGYGQLAGQMAIPPGVWVDGLVDDDLDPARQQGRTQRSPAEFASQLASANPAWDGQPPEPDEDGSIEFTMSSSSGSATVTIVVEPNSADPDDGSLTRWTIDYDR